MGCGSSSATKIVPAENEENQTADNGTNVQKYPPPEAFVIPVTTNEERSIIKKHPPKRLQRLLAETPPAMTLEDLEAKLAGAELRRNEYLQQKASNSVQNQDKATKNNDSNDNLRTNKDNGEDGKSEDEGIY